jgi:1,2-diacylglycerol 3-beta-glucosyltransferase
VTIIVTIILSAIAFAIAGTALILLLPSASDLLSLATITAGRGRRRGSGHGESARFLFLVPAHNEELLLARCLDSFSNLDYPIEGVDVLVVADNCTDATARIAREAGVRCLERDVPQLRGKPHAIAWALETCSLADYDAVAIIDGDTIVDPLYAQEMSRVPGLRHKAAQAYNGLSNPQENALTRMASVLSAAYYRYVYPLKQKAGLNPPLTGAGMCIGAGVLERCGWSAFSLSEDVEMYVRLTLQGVRTECVPEARVYSREAASLEASGSQRQRWRAGRLTILGRLGRLVIGHGDVSWRQRLDLLSELAAPGPAVHLGLVALLSVAALLLPLPGRAWIIGGLLASLVRPTLYTALAIATDARPVQALSAFLFLPIYTGWRLTTEAAAWLQLGDKPWIRTSREGGGKEPTGR